MTDTSTPGAGDLLYGTKAIGAFLGIKQRQVFHLCETKRIPSFKIGKTVCARRSTLAAKLDELEAASGDDSEAA